MLAPVLAGALLVAVPTSKAIAATMPCTAGITVRFDRSGGSSEGVSPSVVLLILRNIGSADCLLPGLPKVQFDDAAGQGLDIEREPPAGMHPGPVVIPIVLAPGAQISAALTWASRDVYAGHHCVTPAKIVIGNDPEAPSAPWRFGQLCGPPGRPISFRQPVLRDGPIPPP